MTPRFFFFGDMSETGGKLGSRERENLRVLNCVEVDPWKTTMF
jgi:hypothetical protein